MDPHHEYLTSLGLDADYAATATTIEPLDLGAELARVCLAGAPR